MREGDKISLRTYAKLKPALFRVTTLHNRLRLFSQPPIIIIIIIITTTMFMVLSSWQSHCKSSPGSFDECRTAPSGCRLKTKPDDLGCESACTGCQNLHPPSPFIIIIIYYYYYSCAQCGNNSFVMSSALVVVDITIS